MHERIVAENRLNKNKTMKNQFVSAMLLALVVLVTGTAYMKPSAKKTVSFKVSGTCEMCKERIEDCLDVKGVYKAVWNVESQLVTVTYNSKKLEEIQLHNLCAIAGHDTEKVKASEQAYADLPECCLYRDGAKCTDHDH
jgi:mercuric ion binding protein